MNPDDGDPKKPRKSPGDVAVHLGRLDRVHEDVNRDCKKVAIVENVLPFSNRTMTGKGFSAVFHFGVAMLLRR